MFLIVLTQPYLLPLKSTEMVVSTGISGQNPICCLPIDRVDYEEVGMGSGSGGRSRGGALRAGSSDPEELQSDV
jgi:hypothetical protein